MMIALNLNKFRVKKDHLKLIHSEKAAKFYKISTLFLSVCTVEKSKMEISQILWPSQNIRTLTYSIVHSV